MPAANIKINGIPSSNDDLPINTLVQLDNANTGGELTFTWVILDQPPGAADALSSTIVQNPTFTPKKEGTYLIKLVVNQTLPSEVSNTKIVGIRQLKSRQRVPAAGETVEEGSRGWAGAAGSYLVHVDDDGSDMGRLVGVVATGAPNVNVGDVCRAVTTETLKIGLPGQEKITGWQTTNALAVASVDQMLAVCIGAVDGGGGPYAPGRLVEMRVFGKYEGLVGVPVSGDPIYVSDTGQIALAPGTVTRQFGSVTRVGGGTYDVWVDGTFGSTVALAAAPPANVNKVAASAGVGTTAARSDHKHDVDTAAATTISIGGANTEGGGNSLARALHTHTVIIPQAQIVATAPAAAVASVFPTYAQVDAAGAFGLVLSSAGIYLIAFSARFAAANNNQDIYFDIRSGPSFAASVEIVGTQRSKRVQVNAGFESIEVTTLFTAVAPTNIYIGACATAGSAITVYERNLLQMRLV